MLKDLKPSKLLSINGDSALIITNVYLFTFNQCNYTEFDLYVRAKFNMNDP